METIFNSNFQTIELETTLSLVKIKWMNTEKLRNEVYKNELVEQLKLIEHFKPKRLLIDTSTFKFVIVPQIQEWNNEHILKQVIQVGIGHVAFLIAEDLFAQVAIEQTMIEETSSSFVTKYFETEQEALTWLKNC